MAGIKATSMQNVLNSTPFDGWVQAYGLDTSFLFGVLGGPKPKLGNFDLDVRTAGNSTAGAFLESANLATAGSATRIRAAMNIKRYYATAAVDGLVEAKAKGMAYDQLSDMILEETQVAVNDILDAINTDLITSGSGAQANGIVYYIATGSAGAFTNTNGINAKFGDQTRSEPLSSFVVSGSTIDANNAVGKHVFDTMHLELMDTRHSNYDAVWCSETQKINYEQTLTGSITYVDAGAGDARFKAALYAGRPVIGIPGYKTDRVDMVRTRDWAYWYVPQVSLDEAGRKISGIFKVEQLAKTTDDVTFTIITYGNLICKNPYMQATTVNLTT